MVECGGRQAAPRFSDIMVDSKTSEELEKDVKLLKDWINKQPHLPKDLDDKVLKRFLHSCYYSLEKTKKCIELFFSIRSSSPELFTNRDPLSQSMQKTLKIL
ncbi:hypothetical protein EVAR_25044_1 [Eumeta japonica]|uniref:Uncharacterized protein n=1 Tax=Eumeta variegata TaxID=151549 RepID=A0A4C1V6K0_EUMVA|nr:hypothetical protein EVAR_25044_1 [Eumeta japonica]